MSEDMTFKGSFRFANHHFVEAALDAFTERELEMESGALWFCDLNWVALEMHVAWDGSAPSSMFDDTVGTLRVISDYAQSGEVICKYGNTDTERVNAYGAVVAADLPPQHHRWRIRAAVESGSIDALGKLQAEGIDLSVASASATEDEQSWLELAREAGSADMVQYLLSAGVAEPSTLEP